ncbi:HEAT repeat domain-containing protein [Natronobiforma cellulositropha]|uniref:HEAT repeat domain-containing protein n=1 Tax=Natronobiforma cellulositropha TaxID=1679076 RepID=UPI0021D5FFC8|nr:HEAT repeat domain-containing protein [Natronobiforma cellulositropha]
MVQPRKVPHHLIETAQSDPDEIDLDEIEELFDDEWEEIRNTGLKVLAGLALDDPERVTPLVDRVIDCLDESYGPARSHAGLVLSLVASDRPDLVEPAIPQLVANLDDPTPMYQYRAARAIAMQLESTPEAFVEHIDSLVDVLAEGPEPTMPEPPDDPELKEHYQKLRERREPDMLRSAASNEIVANVLVEIAKAEPEAFADRLPKFFPVLSARTAPTRGGAVEVIRYVAEADPAAVTDAVDPLIDVLEDDTTFVRARAIRALGYAEAAEAIEPLRSVAESDHDEDLRELAAETADWLEANA